MSSFEVRGDEFVLDGESCTVLSGAIHYFRVVPEYWEDRLRKLAACGLNTVETYVAWNVHEPTPGAFDFSGRLDIERFIRLADDLGLLVIVRPGPYICSEWDLGGLPSWLLRDPAMRLRCSYQPYLQAVDRFFDELFPRLAPLQRTRGGPIIAMQVENEYGSYGNDRAYLEHLRKSIRDRDIQVLLFTSDGPQSSMLEGGTLPDVLKTVNFGSHSRAAFESLRRYQPTGPLMCGEFWNGWFDHWGEEHHRSDPEDVVATLDEMLSIGASVNLYMFHGGTNFGFLNGANYDEHYQPTVTSYDDDSPVGESGEITPKFDAIRGIIAKRMGPAQHDLPSPLPRAAYGTLDLDQGVGLFDVLGDLATPVHSPYTPTMEEIGQSFGFILYRTHLRGPREEAPLVIQDVRDRALVFLNGRYRGTVMRDRKSEISVVVESEGAQLDILVENMGRINYGPYLHDRKGITHGVRLGRQLLFDWEIFPLPLDCLERLEFSRAGASGDAEGAPAFYRCTFDAMPVADTFLHLVGWTKGVCFLNGNNLGRYWDVGPQRSLYVPAPLLRERDNELIVFELHGRSRALVELRDTPDLG